MAEMAVQQAVPVVLKMHCGDEIRRVRLDSSELPCVVEAVSAAFGAEFHEYSVFVKAQSGNGNSPLTEISWSEALELASSSAASSARLPVVRLTVVPGDGATEDAGFALSTTSAPPAVHPHAAADQVVGLVPSAPPPEPDGEVAETSDAAEVLAAVEAAEAAEALAVAEAAEAAEALLVAEAADVSMTEDDEVEMPERDTSTDRASINQPVPLNSGATTQPASPVMEASGMQHPGQPHPPSQWQQPARDLWQAQRHGSPWGGTPSLPPPWVAIPDPNYNMLYYWNQQTNEVTWTCPTTPPAASNAETGASRANGLAQQLDRLHTEVGRMQQMATQAASQAVVGASQVMSAASRFMPGSAPASHTTTSAPAASHSGMQTEFGTMVTRSVCYNGERRRITRGMITGSMKLLNSHIILEDTMVTGSITLTGQSHLVLRRGMITGSVTTNPGSTFENHGGMITGGIYEL